jgi:hypothetical protein
MKKCVVFLLFLGVAFAGCQNTPENTDDPAIPTYDVYFDPYVPQTVSTNETDFQGVLTGQGFLTCTVGFFIRTGGAKDVWVLYHPTAGKIEIQNDSRIVFSINVPVWLMFQDGPDTEVIVTAVIMESGFGTDIVLASVVP